MKTLEYIEEIHGDQANTALVWLHGLGADGYNFKPIVQQLNLPQDVAIHFVFPHAPVRPVTINNGMEMNAWYDIFSLDPEAPEDEQGIITATQSIESLITSKLNYIDPGRIFLAGFSQGGAVALHAFLHGTLKLGGVIALSTYIPLRTKAIPHTSNKSIFLAHGLSDEILPHSIGEQSKELLLSLGMQVDWHSYPIAHQICNAEIEDIRTWLLQQLAR